MKIIFDKCLRRRIVFSIILFFSLFVIFFSSKPSVQYLMTIILLSLIIGQIIYTKKPISLVINKNNSIVEFCNYFGIYKQEKKYINNNIFFKYKREPFKQGMHYVLSVFSKESNKLLFKITEDSHGIDKLDIILDKIKEVGIENR